MDGNGEVANYTYNDPEGALTNISFPAHASQNVTYSYDGYGMPQSVTDQSGTESYSFNASDVLSGVTTTYKKANGTNLPAKTVGYSYNADGSRVGMSAPSGNFAYSYDAIGRPLRLTNPQNEITSWNYLDNNWLKSQRLDNGAVTTYTLNAIGQTLGVTNTNSAGTILSQFGHNTDADSMLGYDGEGKLLKLKSIVAAASTLGGTTNYGYDSKNQLTSESSTRAGNVTNTFGYDATGNPTTWQLNLAGQQNQNRIRTFNANNQETTLNASAQVQFVYDGNGNPTNYKGVATTYDVANHLTSFGTQLTAGYRSDGKRAWKQNASGVRTYFLYDGDALLCELDGTGNVTYTNTWGANGLVSRRDHTASSTRFYTWDDGGSVAQRLDASGNVIDSFTFTAFGQKVGIGGDPYTGYNGQWGYYTDYETGLILCTHRYYDPSSGRWLTRDPIGYSGGLNLYQYAKNNVANLRDPSGKIVPLILGVVFVGVLIYEATHAEPANAPGLEGPVFHRDEKPIFAAPEGVAGITLCPGTGSWYPPLFWGMDPQSQESVVFHERVHQNQPFFFYFLYPNVREQDAYLQESNWLISRIHDPKFTKEQRQNYEFRLSEVNGAVQEYRE